MNVEKSMKRTRRTGWWRVTRSSTGWLEHPDMEEPPKFKIKIISTFKDPLTRQIAESVRIERRGPDILNSKSEYSICKVPRLRIDLEEWKNKERTGLPADTSQGLKSRLPLGSLSRHPKMSRRRKRDTGWRMKQGDWR